VVSVLVHFVDRCMLYHLFFAVNFCPLTVNHNCGLRSLDQRLCINCPCSYYAWGAPAGSTAL
jgi:hypothetical protein